MGEALMWYENGMKMLKANYANGLLFGEMIQWHENGKMKSKEMYVNGKETGCHILWWDNGQEQLKGCYDQYGNKVGKWIYHSYDGKERTESIFIDGKKIK